MEFTKVTKDEFFAKIGPMNVQPNSGPHVTYWELPNRHMVGKSIPGWKCEGAKEWFLTR